MAPPTRSVVRAVLGGLLMGTLGAAVILVAASWRNSHLACEFPGTEQCTFEEATADDVARLQALSAIGFALMSGGFFLALRRR